MTCDRAQIMQEAWTIARRFAGNRETWGQRLSRALKLVWWNVKTAVRLAAKAVFDDAAQVAHFAGRTSASIRGEVEELENTDRLGFKGIERLSAARWALDKALAREADVETLEVDMLDTTEVKIHTEGWLEGVIYCAEFARFIASNDDQKALAERLIQNALEAQAETKSDAA